MNEYAFKLSVKTIVIINLQVPHGILRKKIFFSIFTSLISHKKKEENDMSCLMSSSAVKWISSNLCFFFLFFIPTPLNTPQRICTFPPFPYPRSSIHSPSTPFPQKTTKTKSTTSITIKKKQKIGSDSGRSRQNRRCSDRRRGGATGSRSARPSRAHRKEARPQEKAGRARRRRGSAAPHRRPRSPARNPSEKGQCPHDDE